jgi:ribosome-associated translation inhibitor RaiA
MTIAIHGIRPDTTLGARVSARLETVLAALRVSPISAKATFFDDDGPKGGPAIRCAISVRVPYRPLIRVEHISTTGHLAFEGAFATLERQLERYRERVRDIKRRPKKYFVAKRLLADSPLAPSKAARTRRRKVS